eukprot:6204162-Pleurochrysis_carterae.AAC.5
MCDTLPAAIPGRDHCMRCEIIYHAQNSAEAQVMARGNCQANLKCPESVSRGGATSRCFVGGKYPSFGGCT